MKYTVIHAKEHRHNSRGEWEWVRMSAVAPRDRLIVQRKARRAERSHPMFAFFGGTIRLWSRDGFTREYQVMPVAE